MKHTIMASCLVAAVACSTGAMAGGVDGSSSYDSASSYKADAARAAKRDWYVGGALTGSMPSQLKSKNSDKTGLKGKFTPGASLMVGRHIGKNVRVEGELLYRGLKYAAKKTKDSAGTKVNAKGFGGLVNVYYDFMPGQKFRPYVGAGLGYMSLSGDLKVDGEKTAKIEADGFAFQAGLGASYALTSQWDAFGGYRYLVGPKAEAKNVESGKKGKSSRIKAHEVMLGLRYNF